MATDRLCITQTIRNRAVSQITGYDFNSLARVGDTFFAANEDGVYALGGDRFGSANIDAYFDFLIDFGQVVTIRSLWMAFETTGQIQLTLTFDDRIADARQYILTPFQSGSRQHASKLFVGRGDRGRYLRLRIANLGGCDFGIDRIEAVTIPLGRRRVL